MSVRPPRSHGGGRCGRGRRGVQGWRGRGGASAAGARRCSRARWSYGHIYIQMQVPRKAQRVSPLGG
jgi:hypothetical protein